jgi:hypothetical protein
VLAIVSFVLAALMIGFGIAQRTVLATPDHITAAVTTSSDATVSVIDGATLNSFDRGQTITTEDSGTIVAAYGRTSDVMAWIGDASYNKLTFDPETQKLVSTLVPGSEKEVPDPTGSDLWQADYTQSKQLDFTINVPEDVSVLIVADGIKPAPAAVSVTWLLDNSTPFAGPLVVAGAIVLLLGLGFLLWAVNHVRRSRGPRRKQPKLPKVPKKPTYKPVKRGSRPPAITHGRRSASMVAVPALLVGAMLLSACTADAPTTLENGTAIEMAATGDPSDVPEGQSTLDIPAVTEPQAKRIVTRISAAVTEADTTLDPVLAATRLDGPALALRTANYLVRKVDAAYPAPAVIPPSSVEITLPQQNDSWPRTVFVVVKGEVSYQALMLIQTDPRSQYKVQYAMALEPGVKVPGVASASIGTNRLAGDVKYFTMAPAAIGLAYGDILINDVDSEFNDMFEAEGDTLRVAVGKADKAVRASKIPVTAQLTFGQTAGAGQVIVLGTSDSGAIVAVELIESETIKPVEAGAAVNAPSDVAALIGKALSTKGLSANYGDQLLFYVPPVAKGGKIVLLGYSTGLISASEL